MIIQRMKIWNFGPFKGEHELELGPGVYAVVAKLAGVEGRSNWLGKSTFLMAVPFALFGEHREKTEDAWIFDGADEGGVTIELDDEVVITRSRKRGKSTQVRCSRPARVLEQAWDASGAAAETEIRNRIGLSYEDFRASVYVAQKQMARLVEAGTEPAERMRIVGGWFQLGPLAAAAASTAREFGALVDVVSKANERACAEEATAREILREVFAIADSVELAGVEGEMAAQLEAVEESADHADADLGRIATAEGAAAERRALTRDAEAFAAAVKRGKELKAEHDAILARVPNLEVDLQAAREEATSRTVLAREASTEAMQKKQLARGEFSGTCPVAGIECPATVQIRGRSTENGAAYEEAEKKRLAAVQMHEGAVAIVRVFEKAQDQLRTLSTSIQVQREAALRTQAAARRVKELGAAPATGTDPVGRASLATEAKELRRKVGVLSQARDRVRGHLAASRKARGESEALGPRERALRVATAVLGRTGAQRVVAERGLGEIEDGANRLLEGVGIELGVRLAWSREGTGLAAACEDCGAAFPATTKVKACARCGAARGANVIQKLEPELTDRSGAAEDLGGAAIQLSASSWLRVERGTPWEVALLDEPFGALDAANRRAFAGHLSAMLRSGAVRQAFVVAHHAEVMDALPRRVLIESDGKSSKISTVLLGAWTIRSRRSSTAGALG